MHIPDGMLETRVAASAWLGSAGALAYSLRYVRSRVSDARFVLMAVLAALVFALQMLNFPIAAGTSGHFTGGAAAAILLGPWPAVLVMATVLVVQAFVFADGGVVALGANILNMAVVAPLVGWTVYSLVSRALRSRTGKLVASFTAAWSATVMASALVAVEVWLSGRMGLPVVLGSMSLVHAAIGVGEGFITAGLVGYLLAVRPDLVTAEGAERSTAAGRAATVLGATAFLLAALSFVASAAPDGLERVAGALGFEPGEGAVTAFGSSPIPDYLVPGISNATLAGILAGVVGVAVTGLLLFALLLSLRKRTRDCS